MTECSDIAVVAIGRNEGERLLSCLASVIGGANPIVYVDSGSNDGSVKAAQDIGADAIKLDLSRPFTAARARNTGYERVRDLSPRGTYVQFIDGDCTLHPDWLEAAVAVLNAEPDLAVVCGRRREKFPDATLWNRVIDTEWDSPTGDVRYCGGDALIRRVALDEVKGFREDLIAGEEPEMCFRMRAAGWRIRRIAAEMTLHDAAMTHFGQWWQRSKRAGHTYAEGVALHGTSPERYRITELRRTLQWGLALPLVTLIGVMVLTPWMLSLLLAYPAQVMRLHARGLPLPDSVLMVLGKIAELQGVLGYWLGRLLGRRRKLIEYK